MGASGVSFSFGATALGFADFGLVAFTPGNLTAVAYDGSGAVVAVDSVLTAGAPAALQLFVEENNARPYVADGQVREAPIFCFSQMCD